MNLFQLSITPISYIRFYNIFSAIVALPLGTRSQKNRNELSKNRGNLAMLKLSNKLVLIIFFLLFEVEDLTARESSKGQDLKELDSKILKLKI